MLGIFHRSRFTIVIVAQVERAFVCLLSVSGLQRVSLYMHLWLWWGMYALPVRARQKRTKMKKKGRRKEQEKEP